MAKTKHPLPNLYWVRHFLVCNELAKKSCETRGWACENFAKIILDEESGRLANRQMSCYFWAADAVLSDIRGNESELVFNALNDDHDIYMEDLVALTPEQIKGMYEDYCIAKIKI